MLKARDFIQRIRPYKPGRPIEEVARELGLKGEIIKLASNENPLGTSPAALEAMKGALEGSFLYPDDNCFYLKNALAERYGVEPGEIIVGNGSVELLPLIALAYLGPQDTAIVSEGAFIWFKIAVGIAGAGLIETPMKNYTHDLDAMLAAIKDSTKVVFIANPNNPTGTIVRKKEVERFFSKIPDNVLVVMDKAYREYIDDPEYPDSFGILRKGRNIIILRTFSKIYGLAGVRLGFGIAGREIISNLMRLRLSFNVNRMAQAAGIAALGDDDFTRRSVALNEVGKAFLYEAYKRLGLFYLPTYGNFIFVDFGRDSQVICDALQKKGIITRTIKEYGFPNALRITIGTKEQNARLIGELERITEL